MRKKSTVHTTRTPTLEGGFNVSSKSWIGLPSKNSSFMVKHWKSPKCPQETSQRLPKLKYFSLTTWRFNMLPTVQSWAWRGESVDVLEGFWKKDETYGMRCMKIYLTREQQHGCQLTVQVFVHLPEIHPETRHICNDIDGIPSAETRM